MIKYADLNRTLRNTGPGSMLQNTPYAPQINAQHLQHQQQQESQRRDLAKRQSRKPTDRDLPEGIDDIVIGDVPERYRKLREIEKRLDATMMRKKLDLQDQTQAADWMAQQLGVPKT